MFFFVNCGENDMMHLKFTLYEFSDIELQQPCKSLVLFYSSQDESQSSISFPLKKNNKNVDLTLL